MVNRAPRPCSVPGCPELVRDALAQCPMHRAEADSRKGTRQSRGYDAPWYVVRGRVLATRPACVDCGAPATEVDHITALRAGGARLDPANLRPMCGRCHRSRTGRDQPGGARWK